MLLTRNYFFQSEVLEMAVSEQSVDVDADFHEPIECRRVERVVLEEGMDHLGLHGETFEVALVAYFRLQNVTEVDQMENFILRLSRFGL